jgi:methylenetetrahydrofolate dehydrogenase (NADP+)/methenyltetrahydrofolate cyclohydrolase/formyltetrahydrofolate synthetase
VIGRSKIVGNPIATLLRQANAQVTVCHSGTSREDLAQSVSEADIIIAAAGCPGLVKSAWLKEGVTAVDVGTTFI